MSLDDIINSKKSTPSRGRGGGRGGNRGAPSRGGSGSRGAPRGAAGDSARASAAPYRLPSKPRPDVNEVRLLSPCAAQADASPGMSPA